MRTIVNGKINLIHKFEYFLNQQPLLSFPGIDRRLRGAEEGGGPRYLRVDLETQVKDAVFSTVLVKGRPNFLA